MSINQIEVYITADGLGRAAIIKMPNGLLRIYVHWIWSEPSRQAFNVEGGRTGWRGDQTPLSELYKDVEPEPGFYQEIADAYAAIMQLPGFRGATSETA